MLGVLPAVATSFFFSGAPRGPACASAIGLADGIGIPRFCAVGPPVCCASIGAPALANCGLVVIVAAFAVTDDPTATGGAAGAGGRAGVAVGCGIVALRAGATIGVTGLGLPLTGLVVGCIAGVVFRVPVELGGGPTDVGADAGGGAACLVCNCG